MRLNGLNSVFFCYNFLVFFSHVEGEGGRKLCMWAGEKAEAGQVLQLFIVNRILQNMFVHLC